MLQLPTNEQTQGQEPSVVFTTPVPGRLYHISMISIALAKKWMRAKVLQYDRKDGEW